MINDPGKHEVKNRGENRATPRRIMLTPHPRAPVGSLSPQPVFRVSIVNKDGIA